MMLRSLRRGYGATLIKFAWYLHSPYLCRLNRPFNLIGEFSPLSSELVMFGNNVQYIFCSRTVWLLLLNWPVCFLQYEDPISQEAARKNVPVEEIQEKALVSLAKVPLNLLPFLFFLAFCLLFHMVLWEICWNRFLFTLLFITKLLDYDFECSYVPNLLAQFYATFWLYFSLFILNFVALDIMT